MDAGGCWEDVVEEEDEPIIIISSVVVGVGVDVASCGILLLGTQLLPLLLLLFFVLDPSNSPSLEINREDMMPSVQILSKRGGILLDRIIVLWKRV